MVRLDGGILSNDESKFPRLVFQKTGGGVAALGRCCCDDGLLPQIASLIFPNLFWKAHLDFGNGLIVLRLAAHGLSLDPVSVVCPWALLRPERNFRPAAASATLC